MFWNSADRKSRAIETGHGERISLKTIKLADAGKPKFTHKFTD